MSGLVARLGVTRERFRLDIELCIGAGEVVALLGPNGAGKTTALRAIAGLDALTDGEIVLDGVTLDGPGVFVPAHRRSIGVVFQDYLLFPHLSALENVAFGLRTKGIPRALARATAAAWLDTVGLRDNQRDRPARLSGGQAQRVALARALAPRPALVLMDEPLAALDARTRLETRAELRRHLSTHDGATLLVTHDPIDALVLADRLVIIEGGRVVQDGDAATITARPRTDYVARLVGLNLYRGKAEGHHVDLPTGVSIAVAQELEGDVFVAFSPTAVALHPRGGNDSGRPAGSPRNVWPATVVDLVRHGDNMRVQLAGPVPAAADITPLAAAQLELAPGSPVWFTVKATETRAYPAS
jgi:molybdate transport system ATP-binding protein